jgi:hypothetical protein
VYAIHPRITVKVEYGRGARCADVTIPWHLLRFLDQHAERRFTTDGDVVYRLGRGAPTAERLLNGPFDLPPGSA